MMNETFSPKSTASLRHSSCGILAVNFMSAEDSYRTMREFHRGDVLAPQLLPECSLKIDVLLP